MIDKMKGLVASAGMALAFTLGGTAVQASEPYYGHISEYRDWSGFYIGGHLGGAASLSDWITVTPIGDTFKFDSQGFAGGGHIGFNLQRANLVFGIEASYTATDLSDTVASPSIATVRYTNDINSVFTIGPRIGVTTGPFLAYLKGGYALASARWTGVDTVTLERASNSEDLNGWFVGGGVSMLVTPNIVLGLEYNFHQFESVDLVGVSNFANAYRATGYQNDLHTVMARLSFQFGGRGEPAPAYTPYK